MLFYVKIKPNQRFDGIEKSGNDWLVKIKAPAVDGKANQHLIEYLSDVLDLPKSKILLVKGGTSRLKGLQIEATREYIEQKFSLQIKA
jgi:uncharacterized protein (TIGR00251 family)